MGRITTTKGRVSPLNKRRDRRVSLEGSVCRIDEKKNPWVGLIGEEASVCRIEVNEEGSVGRIKVDRVSIGVCHPVKLNVEKVNKAKLTKPRSAARE